MITGSVSANELDVKKGLRAEDYLINPREEAKRIIDGWLIDTGLNHLFKRRCNSMLELESRIEKVVREAYERGQKNSSPPDENKMCCDPKCPGVAVFDADFTPPKGWVHIERCDECDRFPHDQAAAEWLTDMVGFVCVDCPEPEGDDGRVYDHVVMSEEEANAHKHDRFRVVIPEDSARAAVDCGKLLQWWPDED